LYSPIVHNKRKIGGKRGRGGKNERQSTSFVSKHGGRGKRVKGKKEGRVVATLPSTKEKGRGKRGGGGGEGKKGEERGGGGRKSILTSPTITKKKKEGEGGKNDCHQCCTAKKRKEKRRGGKGGGTRGVISGS